MNELPSLPSLRQYLEQLLGFRLPTISTPQTLKNLDAALARLVISGTELMLDEIDGIKAIRGARREIEVTKWKPSPKAFKRACERIGRPCLKSSSHRSRTDSDQSRENI